MITREKLAEEYYDRVNNYLTLEKFAEHRGLTVDEAEALLQLARQCALEPHPES